MFAWTCLFILLRDAVAFVSFVVFVSATAHYGAYSALFEIFETRNRWWRWKLLTAHIQLNAAIEDRIIKHQLYRFFVVCLWEIDVDCWREEKLKNCDNFMLVNLKLIDRSNWEKKCDQIYQTDLFCQFHLTQLFWPTFHNLWHFVWRL